MAEVKVTVDPTQITTFTKLGGLMREIIEDKRIPEKVRREYANKLSAILIPTNKA